MTDQAKRDAEALEATYALAVEDALRDLDSSVLAEYGESALFDTACLELETYGPKDIVYPVDEALMRKVVRRYL